MRNPFKYKKLFKRRKKEFENLNESGVAPITTVIPSLSARPVDIGYSYSFIENSIDRLEAERKRLKNQTVDHLHCDLRVGESEVIRRRELINSNKQYTAQLYNIQTIVANTKGEIAAAKEQEAQLLKEIAFYNSLLGKDNGEAL